GRNSKQIWQYSAARIDLVAGSMDRPIGIGEKRIPKAVPLPSSGPDATPTVVRTDVSGPVVRRSPDGRSAFAWVSLQQYTDEAQLGTETFGWRIELDGDGSVAAAQG